MDFEREWNADAAADRQQAHDPVLDALAARVKGHHIQPGTMRTVAAGPDGVVVLPAGTDINQIEVDGRNLIVTLPDGTQMVILDGAVVMPHIVVGDVEIPSVNLAALLIGEEPQPAAGPARSSGGNFLAAEGDVGNPHGLGDLLPPTELAFTQPEEREILPIAPEEDHVPELEVPTSGPGTVVDESGLGTVNRPGGSPGSNEPAPVETTAGTITYVAVDTPATISINGQVVTGPGQTITGAHGTLTITSVAPGAIEYSYTLADNSSGDTVTDNFTVTVTDADGDSVTKTLVVNIIDDVPTAHDDLAHQGTEGTPVVINAFANDVFGADGVDIDNNPAVRVTIVSGPAEGAVAYDPATGLFTFTPAAGQEGTATFVYQIQDGDGDTSQATVTVTLEPDSTPTVEVQAGSDTLVDESALNPNGSNAESTAETAAGTLIVTTGNDTVGSLVINNVDVTNGGTVQGSFGTLIVTGSPASGYSYSYTLGAATSGDNTKDSFAVTVTDSDGDTAGTTLTIGIVDDQPHAIDDVGNVVVEDGATNSLSGNVLTNDVSGADTPKSFVAWGADAAVVAELNSYGTLVQNSDGSWSYVLDNSRAATQALGSGFSQDFTLHYTMQDADGDQSPATLTITVKGADDSATVVTASLNGPDATVYEAGLPSGTAHDGSHVTSGSFTVSATDGIASITVGGTSFTLAQMQAFGTTNGVVNTGEGTLLLTGYNAATGAVSYSYTLLATIDNDSKTGATLTEYDDSVTVSVTGISGTSGSDTLIVRIVDDVPQAVNDAGGTLTEDVAGSLSGNVLTNDVSGADTPKSFVAWGADAAVVAELNSYGTLVQNSDGSWSYVLDNSRAATQALGSGFSQDFTLHYTMQDADGDQSPATLTITVKGADDSATVVTASLNGPDATVYEAGLPSGTAHDGSHVTSGSFTVSATDGIASITVGGTSFTLAQMQAFGTTNGVVNTGEGTLLLTGYNAATGAVSYSYTLLATIDNDSKTGATLTEYDDSVTVSVTGISGTSGSDTLIVRIVDDVPQAVNDAGGTLTEDVAGSLSGNVLTNDVSGADTPKSFVAWGADAAVVAELNSYGTLVQNSDGSWSYVLDNSRAATQALGSGFSQDFTLHYTMQDADGDQSPATLTITVKGADDSATVVTASLNGPDATVYEAGLPSGTAHDGSHVTSGSFTVSATDGIASITVGGTSFTLAQMQAFGTTNGVVNTGEGTLLLTGYNAATGAVSYSYTLLATIDNDSKTGATLTEYDDSVTVSVTGISGTSGSDTLIVRIVDDVPQAVNDAGGTLTEDVAGSLSGNVLTNDVSGADTPKSFVAWGADAAVVAELNSYGTLVQNSDGSWSYVLDNSRAATQALGSGFSQDFTLHYTMQDADGDQSPATLTITVKGADDSATVVTASLNGPDATVYEAGLPSGTAHDGSHVTSGSFTVSATDGIASITVGGTSFTLAQMQAFGTTNGVVNTGEGTLLLTGYNAATGAVSYSYTLLATIDNDSKTGATLTEFDDSVTVSVTGISGTSGSDTLVVRIVDDAPHAVNDADSVTEGLGNKADGNVFTGVGGTDANSTDGTADTIGADGAAPGGAVTGARVGTEAGGGALTGVSAAGTTISGTYGDLLIKSDGSYTYTLNTASIPAGVTSETFTYQIKDGDGDTDLAQLVISLNQDGRVPDVTGDTSTVYEDGLADGLQHGAASETDTTGQFTVNANGESYTLTLDGDLNPAQAITAVGQQVFTSKGVLTITSISAPDVNGVVTYGYSYTLDHALTHSGQGEINPLTDTISMTVTDATGDSDATPGSIVVSIVDDVPTLSSVTDLSVANSIHTYSGNDINFTYGADQAGSITLTHLTDITGIVYTGDGTGVVTASVNGNPYFTVSVDQATGDYTVDVLTTRPVVDTPLSFSNIAPGNYTTVTLPGGQVFDGVSYANGTTTAQAFTNDGSTINPSGNGFGVANNLINDNEGFLFSNHDSSSLSFDVNFQPNTSTVTVSWATYAGGTPTAGALPLQTGTFLVTKDADGITHVDIDPTLDFDHMVVRFDYTGSGNPAARVENFSVTQQVIPDDQVLQFAVTVKDADGDIVTSTTPTTTIDVTFQGGAPVPPVAIDLDGDGLEFVDRSLGVTHDYGSGMVSTAWVSSDDGLLAHAIGGSYDIVFADDAPGAKSDLEGLRLAYDGNGDGVFDAHDAAYSEFGVWQDLNSNGVVDGGEFKSLADMGIASIKLTSDGQSYQAAGGDVTVLGEATFTRTDGTTGTVGDVVFATSKDVDLAKTESTTSGFNQALIAASLVAVAGAVETLEQAPAPVVAQAETTVDTAPTATTSTASEPANEGDASTSVSSESQDSHVADQPVEQTSHSGSDDSAPDHSTLSGGDDAPVHAANDDGQAQAALDDHQGLLAQAVNLPVFDGNAAALVAAHDAAPNAQAAQVVAEALGHAGTPNIDALLAALPGGEHAPVLLNPVAGDAADAGHLMAMAASVFDAAMVAHEAMAVAHG
ncbi:VCBS domain-containing protein [Sphingobium chungangianum]